MCRTFGALFHSIHLSRPDGRAYSLPALRASLCGLETASLLSLEEADNSPGRKTGMVWSLYILRPEGPEVARPGRQAGMVWSLYILRPEGPEVARPGRQAGIPIPHKSSAEGAAQNLTTPKLDLQSSIHAK